MFSSCPKSWEEGRKRKANVIWRQREKPLRGKGEIMPKRERLQSALLLNYIEVREQSGF